MFASSPSSPKSSTPANGIGNSQASPSRLGRVRGLSYLRNHTSNHSTTGPPSNALSNSTPRARKVSGQAPQNAEQADVSTPRISGTRQGLGASRNDEETTTNNNGLHILDDSVEDNNETSFSSQPTSATALHAERAQPSAPYNMFDTLPSIVRESTANSTNNYGALRSMSPPFTGRSTIDPVDPGDLSSLSTGQLSSSAPVSPFSRSQSLPHQSQLPSIRFVCHQDLRGVRPSLVFDTLTRTLPKADARIRVGRYSERDGTPHIVPNAPSDAPIGFKSKVVSRRHCEFWHSDNQWYIKDVKSSSGTFLNHIRLSQPGVESRPWPLNDGDIVQLGIDFKGGEEMIFRCVKMRIECNRGWQKFLNKFNKTTHRHLQNLARKGTPMAIDSVQEGDTASLHSTECSICLMSIAPCQSLFVAPCSHTWHYKCIRPVINGPNWPQFQCPNCRAFADLEADIDEPFDLEELDTPPLQTPKTAAGATRAPNRGVSDAADSKTSNLSTLRLQSSNRTNELAATSTTNTSVQELGDTFPATPTNDYSRQALTYMSSDSPASTNYLDATNDLEQADEGLHMRPGDPSASLMIGQTTDEHNEGLMTPTNNAGPFVLDGGGSRPESIVVDGFDSAPRI